MGSNKRKLQILVVAVVLLLGALAYLYFQIRTAGDFWPHENEPETLTYDVKQLSSEIGRLRQEVAKIPAAREQLEKLKVEYDLATRVLPRENNPDQLIAAIRTKAQLAGVVPDRLVPSVAAAPGRGAKSAGAFVEWSFTLDIRGTYDQIATFVNRMEEFESSEPTRTGSEKRFFQVSSISITAEDNGMASINFAGADNVDARQGHKCTLVMQTYRFAGTQ